MEEVWKSVVGYEGLYEVSNLGNVRNARNRRMMGKHFDGRKKYLYVHLTKEGKGNSVNVHRAVAEAFIPNPKMLPQVNHINEVKTDNMASNLEWCTNLENQRYGTRGQRISITNTNGKKSRPVSQYTLDGIFVKRYPSLAEVNRETGMAQANICSVTNGKRRTAYGYLWRYDT